MKVTPFDAPVEVRFEASISPSERRDKVDAALRNLISGEVAVLEEREGRLVFESRNHTSLIRIYEQIRARQTLGVARRLLTQNTAPGSTWVFLNRQAAYVGVVSLCENARESPLGPIRLSIGTPDVQRFIDWLAPR